MPFHRKIQVNYYDYIYVLDYCLNNTSSVEFNNNNIYSCEVIALGDGTACRETEFWLRNIDKIKHLPLVIVPEQGASIYSCSAEAAKVIDVHIRDFKDNVF